MSSLDDDGMIAMFSTASTTQTPAAPDTAIEAAADSREERRMSPMFAKAPTLAWLLTALACFMAGMAVTEGRHQAGSLSWAPTVGVVVTVEVTFPPVATEEPTATPAPGGSGDVP